MLNTLFATLDPMMMLFLCIAVGFIIRKAGILPDNAGKVMAKLVTWVFSPALSFSTMARFCTLDSLKSHALNIVLATFCVFLGLGMAVFLARFFVKENNAERGVYKYALAVANGGYVGDPVVLTLFGDRILSYYKLFYLPFSILIYTWGISVLVPAGETKKNFFKKILNAPTVAMFIGIIVGITGLGAHLPSAVTSTLNSLKSCMGPVAMLLAGVTVANYDMKRMLKNGRVYIATGLRLVVLPSIIILSLFGFKELINLCFNANIGNSVLFLALFATATPLGLNTVVFPEAYGGNPETGASMAMISHTLCVLTIPLMYAVMAALFGGITI